MKYIATHCHTDASNLRLIDSTIKVDKLINTAINIGLGGVAITDHDLLSNHMSALKAIEKKRKDNPKLEDFKLILGNEIYLVRDGLNKENYDSNKERYFHFILLAKDAIGHRQLRDLSSIAWDQSYRQFIERTPTYYNDLENIIGDDIGHLIGSTACLGGFLGYHMLERSKYLTSNPTKALEILEEIYEWIDKVKGFFAEGDFYIELQPSFTDEQKYVNEQLFELATMTNLPLIITTDAHYARKEDRRIHKAYLQSKEGEREVDAFYASTYLMTRDEILEYFKDTCFTEYDVDKALQNTIAIGQKCTNYELQHKQIIPKINPNDINFRTTALEVQHKVVEMQQLTNFKYFDKFINSKYEQDRLLFNMIADGIIEKYKNKTDDFIVRCYERINIELSELWKISEKLGERLSSYLPLVSKIIELIWTKGDSFVGPSRGSALGFVICYLLDIVQIDPIDKTVDLPHWRFINEFRVSLPDIDIDTQSNRRTKILTSLKNYFGEENVVNILTLGTEKSKSAIQTACRGLKVDVDIGVYLSSMIPSERGSLWSLDDCFNGNEEKERKPIKKFVTEMSDKYSEVWEVAKGIESLITQRGIHAAGVIITNGEFCEFNALMRSPKGQKISQFDLHDSEDMGGLKFDLLSVEALDKNRAAVDLLIENNEIEGKATLKETYMSLFNGEIEGVVEFDNLDMWKLASDGKVLSLFQFETPMGGDAIKRTKPKNIAELSMINSLMRLMNSDGEMPLDTYIKYKEDITLWYMEMDKHGLSIKEQEVMKKHLLTHYGIAESQETMMLLVLDKEISNFTLSEADKLRKVVAKKSGDKAFQEIEDLFYKKGQELGSSLELLNYVWNIQIKRQKGYSFSQLHTYGYSFIALQQLNLVHKFPAIYWNTSNLIIDSSGQEEEVIPADGKIVTKSVDYGKVSTAIGRIQSRGVELELPDINKSKYTFTPDVDNNIIRFGIKGIARIGDSLVHDIIVNRPYTSMEDFRSKVKVNILQMANLVKAGVFDIVEDMDRVDIMRKFIDKSTLKKLRLTLQNMPMLIRENLIPEDYKSYQSLYNFNKYLKGFKVDILYQLDDRAFNFYAEHYNTDDLIIVNEKMFIAQKEWDKVYKKAMNPMREYLKEDNGLLQDINKEAYNVLWNKYALGTISKWEMDSLSFYSHEHELANVNFNGYNIRNFFKEDEYGTIKTIKQWKGKPFPIYELYRIAGTVLSKDKGKNSITLLTNDGVVMVKIWQAQFSKYDKQVSKILDTGKKKIIEKSWFSRGNKLLITGTRRGDNFMPKIYKYESDYSYPIELITNIKDDGSLVTQTERAG